MNRQRWTADQWRDVLEQQRQSGQSVPAFCAERGLKPSTFFAWRRRLVGAAESAGNGFVELMTRRDEASAPGLELVLARGVVVRVGQGFDADLLRRVVETLS